eukprot:UN07487
MCIKIFPGFTGRGYYVTVGIADSVFSPPMKSSPTTRFSRTLII